MSRRARVAFVVVFVVTLGGGAFAGGYDAASRRSYLSEGLAAMTSYGALAVDELRDFVDREQRTSCRSSTHDLELRCLARAVEQQCKSSPDEASCRKVGDVVVTNKMSEPGFISVRQRYELMRTEESYRESLRGMLEREYAHLAAELFLDGGRCADGDHVCLGAAIDTYCADQAERPWNHCAAALVFFIGRASSSHTSDADAR